MPKLLGFLGPAGTFCEEAALLYNPKTQLIPSPQHQRYSPGGKYMIDKEIVSIENSLEGWSRKP